MIQTVPALEGEPQKAPRQDSQTMMNEKSTQCDWKQSPWLWSDFPKEMKPQKHQTHLLFLDDFQKTTQGCDCAWKTQKIKQKRNIKKEPRSLCWKSFTVPSFVRWEPAPTKCKDGRESLTGSHPFKRGSEHEVNARCFKQKINKQKQKQKPHFIYR